MIRLHRLFTLVAAICALTLSSAFADGKPDKDGFVSIFDGISLENWDGNPQLWRVEDGAITGQTTKEKPTKGNTFLIYRGSDTHDFELKLDYKIVGGNSGIQYRSFEVKNNKWVIGGYQADIDSGDTYSGILYGERFRGILCGRGQITTIGENGKPTITGKLGESKAIQAKIKKEDWNSYHIIAKGNTFTHLINGVKTAQCTDEDDAARASGVLALQLHAGPPMKVQFKNIRIKQAKKKKAAAVEGANDAVANQKVVARPFSGLAQVADEKAKPTARGKRIAFVAGVKSHGYGSHEHKAGSILLAKSLKKAMPNFNTVVYTDGWPKDPNALDGFDCIVMYCDGGGRHMVNPHLKQVDRYAKQGVGIVCIHYGVEVPIGPSGKAFLDWIGGYFEANWSVNPHWDAHFKKFPKHPITQGVGPFNAHDEWYYHMRFRPDMKGVTPILSDMPPESTLVRPDGSLARPDNAHNNNPHVRKAVLERKEPQHVAWAAVRPDGGRGFGFTGGHVHWNWGNNNLRKVVLNAIVWCAKGEVPKNGVESPAVTMAELKENQDYKPRGNFNEQDILEMLDKANGTNFAPKAAAKTSSIAPGKKIKALFRTKVVNSQTKGHSAEIDVDLKGAKKVFLAVTDAGNGFACDWANWVNPRFVGPKGEIKLTELKWKSAKAGFGNVRVGKNNSGRDAYVDGKLVKDVIGTHANSLIEYDVPAGFTHFKATGALDKGGVGQATCGNQSSVVFAVYNARPANFGALVPVAAGAGQSRDSESAVKQLDVAKGLKAELFASEPLMLNPTNIDIDHKGRVWVCEVVNYRRFRNKDHKERKAGDTIIILSDSTGDGKLDKRQVFYQGRDIDSAHGLCLFPTPNDKGTRVLVSAKDQVFWLTDEDGDLKADKKKVLFTGIGGTEHDHGIHAFVFGPDGKLYFNFGNAGRQVKDASGKPLIDMDGNGVNNSRKPYQEGMVFRCNLDGSEFETLGWNFRNNWEVCVDSFGTLWQSDNDDDGNKGTRINFVMEFGNYGYKDEFTGAGWKAPRFGMADEIPLRHWHLNDPGVMPNLLQTGQGSPTGILLYEGTLLPKQFQNQIIHCDAGPNVVRAYPMKDSGAGYSAESVNVLHGARDNWFRPSDVCVAPDGSLIVADWYDPGVGGHRMQDIQRGRLFRVAPPGSKYKVPAVDVSTIAGAIKALESPNLAIRQMAWMVLHNGREPAEEALRKTFASSKNQRLRARALWLLGKFPGKGSKYVAAAIDDSNSNIRIVGLRLARQLKLDIIPIAKKLAKDKNAQVRREVAVAIRHNKQSEAARIWADLALQHDGKDRWYLEALGSSADGQWDEFLAAWAEKLGDNWNTDAARDIVWRSRGSETPKLLVSVIRQLARDGKDVSPRYIRAFDFQKSPGTQDALVQLAFMGLPAKYDTISTEAVNRIKGFDINKNPEAKAALARVLKSNAGTSQFVRLVDKFSLSDQYAELLNLAIKHPTDQIGADSISVLLGKGQSGLVKQALNAKQAEIAVAVANALATSGDGRAVGLTMPIVKNDKKPLEIRRASARACASSRNGALQLLVLARKGELDAALVPAVASRLHASLDRKIRNEAVKLWPLPPSKNNKPLPPISELAKRKGNVQRGLLVFQKAGTCANCHVVNKQGKEVGPDLSEIGSKLSRTAFYESILFPSAAVSHNYETHSVILNDGNVVNGILSSQTDESVTIKTDKAIERTIKKSDVDEMIVQKISMMPADIQKLMTEQDLIDVVEYMTTLKKKPVVTASTSNPGDAIRQRLKTKIAVKFQRVPLYKAIVSVTLGCKVSVSLDGDALKSEGYTKNMPQTFQANESGLEILHRITDRYAKMVVAIDVAKNEVIITSEKAAKKKNLLLVKSSN
jgi:putative membrane-bound dehydrogenase-like protein